MKINIFNQKGEDTGRKAKLDDAVFGIEPNEHAIYLDVKQHLANKRQGTHKTKERSEIARTTKKAYKQKGTGNARVGSMRSPIQRGGGTVFGPRPHGYGFKLNKKVKRLARKSALSMKAGSKAITVLDQISMDAPRTKDYSTILNALKLNSVKTLVVLDESDQNVYLSARNLQRTEVITLNDLNTYKVMNAQNLVLTEASASKLNESLS
jgi:large subunit ribosomal protein L4